MNLKRTATGAVLVILVAGLASCSSSDKVSNPQPGGYTGLFGISYPPVGTDDEFNFTARSMENDLDVNSLRFSVHWDLIQPDNAAEFDWNSFDQRIQQVRDNGLNLFLTVEAKGPEWACGSLQNEHSCLIDDPQAFESFLTKLLSRYGDDIEYIQFGNEMISPNFWVGTVEQFTELSNIFYNKVKELRPDIPVVLGGFSSGVLRNFAACAQGKDLPIPADGQLLAGAEVDSMCATMFSLGTDVKVLYLLREGKYDLIDIHLYDDPEYWPLLQEAIQEVAPGVSLMVTEFGGPMVECLDSLDDCILGLTENEETGSPYTEEYHAVRLAFYMETLKTMALEKAYHFKLSEDTEPGKLHDKSGLYRYSGGSIVPKQSLIDTFVAHK